MASADAGAAPGTSPRSTTKGDPPATSKGKRAKRDKGEKKKKRPAPVVPDTPGVARVIAIANQKGGVGKSTTAVSLGAALADIGFRVLVVDLDPQGNASTGLGIRHEAREISVYDVIVSEASVTDAIVPTPVERLAAVPSTIDLAGAEIELVSQFSRETRLKKALEAVREGSYDFILLDCPPSLGLLTINALTAAEELIVPIQCEYYALEGLGQLLRNVSLVQQNINPGLRVSGIVMTMFDPRTKLSEQVVDEVKRYFGDLVYDAIIPRTVRLSEAPGFGQPITEYDPRSKGATSYRELGREVALRPPPTEPMPEFDDLPTVVVPPLDESMVEEEPDDAGLEEPIVGSRDEELEPQAEEEAGSVDLVVAPEPEPEAPPEPAPLPEPAPEPTPPPESRPEPAAIEPEPQPIVPESGPEPEAIEREPVVAESRPEPAAIESEPTPEPIRSSQPVLDDDDVWEQPEPRDAPRVAPPPPPAPATGARSAGQPGRRVVVIDEDAEISAATNRDRPSEADREGHEERVGADIGATLEHEGHVPKRRWRLFRKGGE
jgi:chromosome partitioning protein